MDAGTLDLIFKGGGWGVAVILFGLLIKSYSDRLSDAKIIIALAQKVEQAMTVMGDALNNRTGWFERAMLQGEKNHLENTTTLSNLRLIIEGVKHELSEARKKIEEATARERR